MDLLQVALIFLILLLSIFLAITGFQVFLILRDLKKALDKLNNVLHTGENIAENIEEDIERPMAAASNLAVSAGEAATRAIIGAIKKGSKPKTKRFYKKVL